MKKLTAILTVTGLLLLACGGGDEAASQPDETVSQIIPEEQDTPAEDIPVQADPPPLYPEGTLDPSLITEEIPVDAEALYESFFIWDGRTITIEGYPYIFYGMDSTVIDDEIDLIAELGSRDVLTTAVFDDSCGATVWADQLLTVRGTIAYKWSDKFEIVDARIVSNASPAQEEIVTSPYVYDGVTPIPIGDFRDMFNLWIGKELTVEGYFNSITTSTLNSGVIVRVDLGNPSDGFVKYVACEMEEEISDGTDSIMVANRAGTQIRGTVIGKSFNMVGLENCRLINR